MKKINGYQFELLLDEEEEGKINILWKKKLKEKSL
jgi:hypothetical protein